MSFSFEEEYELKQLVKKKQSGSCGEVISFFLFIIAFAAVSFQIITSCFLTVDRIDRLEKKVEKLEQQQRKTP